MRKKHPPPHGLFCGWPMARRNEDHICKVCSDDLSDLSKPICKALDMVCTFCTLSKCVKNAVFRKNNPPSAKPKHHHSRKNLK